MISLAGESFLILEDLIVRRNNAAWQTRLLEIDEPVVHSEVHSRDFPLCLSLPNVQRYILSSSILASIIHHPSSQFNFRLGQKPVILFVLGKFSKLLLITP